MERRLKVEFACEAKAETGEEAVSPSTILPNLVRFGLEVRDREVLSSQNRPVVKWYN